MRFRLANKGIDTRSSQDYMEHSLKSSTVVYRAELSRLIEAAIEVCERGETKPELVVLRRVSAA